MALRCFDPEWVSGNIFIRRNLGKAGEVIDGREHNFAHTTFVQGGSVRVKRKRPSGEVTTLDFVAPSHFLVHADSWHEITFLEDGEIWCVYSHRDPQGRVVQEFTGWERAYT